MTTPLQSFELLLPWGDSPGRKPSTSIRLVFQNGGDLPASSNHSYNDQLAFFVSDFGVDIIGIAEVNLNWSRVPLDDRLPARFRSSWERVNTQVSFLSGSNDISQTGGTAMLSINSLASRVQASGYDDRRLGRWC
jgi:hypothetical protein